MRKIFISYSRKDINLVRSVRGIAQAANPDLSIFVDNLSLSAGDDWECKLIMEINECDAFYVIWTYHAKNSRWVAREIELALSVQITKPTLKIIPIEDGVTPLPKCLSKYQSIALTIADNTDGDRTVLNIVSIISGAAAFYLLRFLSRDLIELVFCINLWISCAMFSALRVIKAPWRFNKNSKYIYIFFSTIQVNKFIAQSLLIANAAMSFLIYLIYF